MTSLFSNKAGDATFDVDAYVKGLTELTGRADPLEILPQLPGKVRAAVAGLTDAQLRTPESPGKWSMRDVIRHLTDGELVFAWRYRMIIAHDRPEISGYDQDLWVSRLDRDDDIEVILEELEAVRMLNLRLLRRQPPEVWERVGMHAERGAESLARLARMGAGHDIVHTRQLLRIRDALTARY